MRDTKFWITLLLSSITILVVVFVAWELIEKNFFKELDYKAFHSLYITRGVATSLILVGWAVYFIWREKFGFTKVFEDIIENSSDAILAYDDLGTIVAYNREAERSYGKNKKIWEIVPSENIIKFKRLLEQVKDGKPIVDFETERLNKNGERVPVSINLTYTKDHRFLESIRDIRDRILLRNKIIEMEKTQLLGNMAEGVAHHMGTPLASMLLRVQMLKEDLPKFPDTVECVGCLTSIEAIEKQIFYGQKVIQRLLKFVRKSDKEKRARKIYPMLEESIELIRPLTSKQGIKVDLRLEEQLKQIEAFAEEELLELVFSDIMMNSIDAMPQGGKIYVEVSLPNHNDQIEIKITDEGMGIPKDILPYVFQPFFTTKPGGKGTGLGLAVAKRIIEDHGGKIGVESEEGKGTQVTIDLPLYKEILNA